MLVLSCTFASLYRLTSHAFPSLLSTGKYRDLTLSLLKKLYSRDGCAHSKYLTLLWDYVKCYNNNISNNNNNILIKILF